MSNVNKKRMKLIETIAYFDRNSWEPFPQPIVDEADEYAYMSHIEACPQRNQHLRSCGDGWNCEVSKENWPSLVHKTLKIGVSLEP